MSLSKALGDPEERLARRIRSMERMLETCWCEELERDLENARRQMFEIQYAQAHDERETMWCAPYGNIR